MIESLSLEEVNIVKDKIILLKLEKGVKAIKDRKHFFEHEEDYKPVRIGHFGVKIILNIKVKVIEKQYQLKNI